MGDRDGYCDDLIRLLSMAKSGLLCSKLLCSNIITMLKYGVKGPPKLGPVIPGEREEKGPGLIHYDRHVSSRSLGNQTGFGTGTAKYQNATNCKPSTSVGSGPVIFQKIPGL